MFWNDPKMWIFLQKKKLNVRRNASAMLGKSTLISIIMYSSIQKHVYKCSHFRPYQHGTASKQAEVPKTNLSNGKSAMIVGCGYKDELKYR